MNQLLGLILATCFTSTIIAQEFSQEYGKVTKDELNLNNYPSDKTAPAAVLYDIGRSFFVRNTDDFDVIFERTTKVKIFTEAGLKFAEIEIPFYHSDSKSESVEVIEAITYNLVNNNITKTRLDIKNKFTEKISDRWSILKFAIPDVKPGSVIEYKYKVISPYKFNLRDWEFQNEIPVKFSKYKVEMIPFYSYTYLLQGASKFDNYNTYESSGFEQIFHNVEYHYKIHEYTMIDVPAFIDEGFITSKNDYIIKIDFQLSSFFDLRGVETKYLSTWPALCSDILKDKDFGKFINSAHGNNAEYLETIKSKNLSDIELLENIVDFIKKNYSWNGRNSWFATQTVKEFEKTKIGNSAEINLYLLSNLLDAGFNAQPVILSTRENGRIKADFPFIHFFNYVLVSVQLADKTLLLDATEPLLPFHLIPPKCINDKGLVVQKKKVEWVVLLNNQSSKINTSVFINLNTKEDSVKAVIKTLSNNFDAFNQRKQINDDEKNLINFIEAKQYTQFYDFKTVNFYERNEPFIISYKVNHPYESINEKIFLDPFLFETINDNPLKQKDRQYPIDFIYSKERTFVSIISIPEGYKVESLPGTKNIDDSYFLLSYEAKESPETKSISVSAKYYFKKAVYEPEDYRLLKYYYSEIVNKLNERIVLAKTK